jgi:Escherichia/Staphylococcus phage prohead protease
MERRILSSEVRATKSGSEMRISGYAANYNVLSADLGNFKERIAKRAFDRILSTSPDTACLLNHDVNNILGRTTSGTLTLRGDDKGLSFNCSLPNTQAGRDTFESVKRGDLSGCSFAFNLGQRSDGSSMESWNEEEEIDDEKDLGLRGKAAAKKIMVRTIRDFASLMDVSVVTYPAYGNTSIAARHNIVSAEVRSHLQAIRNPQPTKRSKLWQGIRTEYGNVSLEDAVQMRDNRIIRSRRKQMTNFLLS